ncbi:troponin C [Penaeus vannamei]|uniref:Troponin C n=1 Tax=Penaeus vannamei TaxID=6689 RepID=A0A3R7QG92_PENVA|nr:troponin C [Penaeus vannamei]
MLPKTVKIVPLTEASFSLQDSLEEEQLEALRKAFNSFDRGPRIHHRRDRGHHLEDDGIKISEKNLQEVIAETDEDGSGLLEFEEFAELAAKFLMEEDEEALKKELKEAFRFYDKECK